MAIVLSHQHSIGKFDWFTIGQQRISLSSTLSCRSPMQKLGEKYLYLVVADCQYSSHHDLTSFRYS